MGAVRIFGGRGIRALYSLPNIGHDGNSSTQGRALPNSKFIRLKPDFWYS